MGVERSNLMGGGRRAHELGRRRHELEGDALLQRGAVERLGALGNLAHGAVHPCMRWRCECQSMQGGEVVAAAHTTTEYAVAIGKRNAGLNITVRVPSHSNWPSGRGVSCTGTSTRRPHGSGQHGAPTRRSVLEGREVCV